MTSSIVSVSNDNSLQGKAMQQQQYEKNQHHQQYNNKDPILSRDRVGTTNDDIKSSPTQQHPSKFTINHAHVDSKMESSASNGSSCRTNSSSRFSQNELVSMEEKQGGSSINGTICTPRNDTEVLHNTINNQLKDGSSGQRRRRNVTVSSLDDQNENFEKIKKKNDKTPPIQQHQQQRSSTNNNRKHRIVKNDIIYEPIIRRIIIVMTLFFFFTFMISTSLLGIQFYRFYEHRHIEVSSTDQQQVDQFDPDQTTKENQIQLQNRVQSNDNSTLLEIHDSTTIHSPENEQQQVEKEIPKIEMSSESHLLYESNNVDNNNNTTTSTSTTSSEIHIHNRLEQKNTIVHVVQTRFMQFQSKYQTLGMARLKLFQAITIPSIAAQTNTNFLWIIRTDPLLHPTILNDLIQTLQDTFGSSNSTTKTENVISVVLVGSNENPEGFRSDYCIHDIRGDTIFFGATQAVYDYHNASKTSILLETRLDADDALVITYVDALQQSAYENMVLGTHSRSTLTIEDTGDGNPSKNYHDQFGPSNNTVLNNTSGWMVWCAENHIEWQYASPWKHNNISTSLTNEVHDHTVDTSIQYSQETLGALLGLKAQGCITPGLTWGYTINASREDIPTAKHDQIGKLVTKCNVLKEKKHKKKNASTDTQIMNCLHKLGSSQIPAAFRARTPTSAGMDHVYLPGYTDKVFPMKAIRKSKWKTLQYELFHDLIPGLFHIQPTKLLVAREYIHHHLPMIAQEAFDGQCTKGHSCKEGTKEILKRIASQ